MHTNPMEAAAQFPKYAAFEALCHGNFNRSLQRLDSAERYFQFLLVQG